MDTDGRAQGLGRIPHPAAFERLDVTFTVVGVMGGIRQAEVAVLGRIAPTI
ncbi:hypothetical protein [Embleya sp. NPDC020886]|uniref:hypothetical protein n=1 Tax=Embleya sp. NPDC020886 TaxID=3363980 RepID=UPI0037B036E8